ncbi:hypothetical protein HK104_004130 [Borealophlyctis nickersoniae]|nr:hypothetical protein HK104_004130 [Borealophlyctis nickersoniae]
MKAIKGVAREFIKEIKRTSDRFEITTLVPYNKHKLILFISESIEEPAATPSRFEITTLLPYIKHELILSIRESALAPEGLLTLIKKMKPFPDLSDVVQICVNRGLENWSAVKNSDAWRELVSGPESSDWYEMFMDRALELRR